MNLINLNVNGQDVTIVDYETYDFLREKKDVSNILHKIPFTNYYLYERAFTLGLLVKLSGLEKLGEVDMTCDLKAIKSDAKSLLKAKREGCLPVTFYPKRGSGEPVRWIFWSELEAMAFDNIRKSIRKQDLHGYDVQKCCLKNKKTSSRSKFPKLNVKGMF